MADETASQDRRGEVGQVDGENDVACDAERCGAENADVEEDDGRADEGHGDDPEQLAC